MVGRVKEKTPAKGLLHLTRCGLIVSQHNAPAERHHLSKAVAKRSDIKQQVATPLVAVFLCRIHKLETGPKSAIVVDVAFNAYICGGCAGLVVDHDR